jgi:hypothetical protein
MQIDIPEEGRPIESEVGERPFSPTEEEVKGLQLIKIFRDLSQRDQDKVLSFATELSHCSSSKP